MVSVTNAYYWNLLDFNWNLLFYWQFHTFLFALTMATNEHHLHKSQCPNEWCSHTMRMSLWVFERHFAVEIMSFRGWNQDIFFLSLHNKLLCVVFFVFHCTSNFEVRSLKELSKFFRLYLKESLPYSCHCLFKLGQSVMRLCGAKFFSVKILYSKLVSLLDRISLSLKPQAPGVEWNSVRWKKCIIIATWLCYLLRSLPMISPVFVEFACKLSKTWIHRMVNEMMVCTHIIQWVCFCWCCCCCLLLF